MDESKVCSKCGKDVEDKSKFCPSSGGNILLAVQHEGARYLRVK